MLGYTFWDMFNWDFWDIYFLGYVGMYLGYTWDLLWVSFGIFWAVLGYLGIVSGIFWDVHVFFELMINKARSKAVLGYFSDSLPNPIPIML